MGRAIVRRPKLFLMDEPLSNLDSQLRAELRAEISSLVRELGVTCVYVTHDQAEALTMADRVAILRRGVLQDVGTPTEVYGRPATLYVAGFLGSPRMSLMEATRQRGAGPARRPAPRRPGPAPAVERPAGPRGGPLPRRAHRHRAAARGVDARVRSTRRATCCAVGSGTWSTTGTSRWPSSTSAPPRWWSTRWPRPGQRRRQRGRQGPAPAGRPVRRPAGSRDSRDGRSTEPLSAEGGRHHRRPAELVVRLAPYPASAPATRWRSRCGSTPCTFSRSGATGSTLGGCVNVRPHAFIGAHATLGERHGTGERAA